MLGTRRTPAHAQLPERWNEDCEKLAIAQAHDCLTVSSIIEKQSRRGAYLHMKRRPGIRDIYKNIRKPVAPPTKVEGDRRDEIRGRENGREIEKHRGRRRQKDAGREE
jgi:hypothetical protein